MQSLTSESDFVAAGSEASWQHLVRNAVRSADELRQRVGLPRETEADLVGSAAAESDFPVFVPEPWLNRIRKGDPNDPLLRQVLAVAAERLPVAGFVNDPLEESGVQPIPGLLHKYPGRVLLVATGACAINCRYCFRRHFPYENAVVGKESLQRAFDHISTDDSIDEIILSGGDPLMLSDERLEWIVQQAESISHVRRLRVHSRLPIAIPQRVNESLCALTLHSRLTFIVVVHSNHANEIDDEVADALRRLKASGQTQLLNQSVLLRGVNDSFAALAALSHSLTECGVMPYYLHQLDRVAGAADFHVAESRGLELIAEMESRLSGYLIPKYVRETPGESGKSRIV